MPDDTQGFSDVLIIDAFSQRLSRRLQRCKREWLKGRPLDEVALLNRMTASLNSPCHAEVMAHSGLQLRKQFFELHRRGIAQKDLYGADLAVTLHAPAQNLTKTAFFQLKKSSDDKVEIRQDQTEAAKANTEVWQRSFVVSAGAGPGSMRVSACAELPSDFGGRHTQTLDSSKWTTLRQWLDGWLRCRIGVMTDLTRIDAPERLLAAHAFPEGPPPWIPGLQHDVGFEPPAPTWLTAEVGRARDLQQLGEDD